MICRSRFQTRSPNRLEISYCLPVAFVLAAVPTDQAGLVSDRFAIHVHSRESSSFRLPYHPATINWGAHSCYGVCAYSKEERLAPAEPMPVIRVHILGQQQDLCPKFRVQN
jgi:hypothetical protein